MPTNSSGGCSIGSRRAAGSTAPSSPIVSDHGEGLGDHGEAEHGILLYREALHVPWILRLPGGRRSGRRVAGTLGLVDVAATLLDLAGARSPALDGQTVRRRARDAARVDRTVYSETLLSAAALRLERSRVSDRRRYHYIRAPLPELYDLLERSRGAPEPGRVTRANGERSLAQLDRTDDRTARDQRAGAVPADVRERLRVARLRRARLARRCRPPAALPGSEGPDRERTKPSSARCAIERPAARRKRSSCIATLLARESATCWTRWESLAKSLVAIGRTPEAIDAFGKVLDIEPLKPETAPRAGAHLRARAAAARCAPARRARRRAAIRRRPTRSSPS